MLTQCGISATGPYQKSGLMIFQNHFLKTSVYPIKLLITLVARLVRHFRCLKGLEFFSCEKEVKTFLGVTLTISRITLTHIQSYLEYETA